MTEIEKKYLLTKLPNLQWNYIRYIKQMYLVDGEFSVVRIRSVNDKAYLTIKGEGTVEREEFESEISIHAFNLVWKENKPRLEKTRHYFYFLDENLLRLLEVDEYHGFLKGLFTAEIEFPTRKEYDVFNKPDFLSEAIDISEESKYKNNNLVKLSSLSEL